MADNPMIKEKVRSSLIWFVTVCSILGVAAGVIAYGRGYRLDVRKNTIKPTGLVSATSDPVGAQVFVDSTLKTATNNSFNIEPGWYTVRIAKEGYLPWEKKLRIHGEVVMRADAFLFPTNPSLSPLTTTGIANAILSPDGTKVAYAIPPSKDGQNNTPASKKEGLWVYELAERTLGRNRDPIQIAPTTASYDFSKASLVWSPDSSQLLAVLGREARLYQAGRQATFQDVSQTLATIFAEWNEQKMAKERQKLAAFPQPVVDMATSSARIVAFSPDETKLLYEATAAATIPTAIVPALIGTNPTDEQRTIKPGSLYVYDSREDKNYFLLDKKELPTPTPTARQSKTPAASIGVLDNWIIGNSTPSVAWFPTNKHLVLTGNGKIDVMEYDRTNWITVYSGPFSGDFLAPWPNGSRLVILTNLNPGASTLPNLYTVNLR